MNADHDLLDQLQGELNEYFQLKREYYKLTITEKVAKGAGKFASSFVMILLAFFCLIFLSLFAGIAISIWLKSYIIGFGLVGAFYLILTVIVYFARQSIEVPLINGIIKSVYENENLG